MDDAPPSLYTRRVENEWDLLCALRRLNPCVLLEVNRMQTAGECTFDVRLARTYGLLDRAGAKELIDSHEATFRFPRFFPSVPIEASLSTPVFHPNVDPVNGFVCLWDRVSARDNVMDAIRRLQRIISWDMLNFAVDHLMQPEAAAWYLCSSRTVPLPLEFTLIEEDPDFRREFAFRRHPDRKRLVD